MLIQAKGNRQRQLTSRKAIIKNSRCQNAEASDLSLGGHIVKRVTIYLCIIIYIYIYI